MDIFELSSIWPSGPDRRIVRPAVAWNRGIVITDVALPRELHSNLWHCVPWQVRAGYSYEHYGTVTVASETKEVNQPREPGSVVQSLNRPGCPKCTLLQCDLWFVKLHLHALKVCSIYFFLIISN